jgi:ribose 5-phosphate isomerase A
MKEAAGRGAVEALVVSGMKLGLGTGSTAIHAIRQIGALLREGKLWDIRGAATSFQTQIACERWGIPLYSLNAPEMGGTLDLTSDGAAEVDPQGRCVTGGGGALLMEKIVAYASKTFALVVDGAQRVGELGRNFPVPVEVIPEARLPVSQALEKLGAEARLREAVRKAGPVITEHGNLLLDILFREPVDPESLEGEINRIPGVVENGFFTRLRPVVFIGLPDGTVERRD